MLDDIVLLQQFHMQLQQDQQNKDFQLNIRIEIQKKMSFVFIEYCYQTPFKAKNRGLWLETFQ